jgi:hypothetical protein
MIAADSGDGVVGGGVVCMESTELNLYICVKFDLNSSNILSVIESQSLQMGVICTTAMVYIDNISLKITREIMFYIHSQSYK